MSEAAVPGARSVPGRVKWKRFAIVMVPSAAVAAVLIGLTAEGAIGANISVSGQEYLVTATQLVSSAASATFSGNVVLYATKLSGKLLGVPLTLTPGNAESTLLQLLNTLTPLVPVTMTNVTADEPVVLGSFAAVNGLAVTAS